MKRSNYPTRYGGLRWLAAAVGHEKQACTHAIDTTRTGFGVSIESGARQPAARLTRTDRQGSRDPRVGSERVRRHPHRRARSAPACGVSRGPRAYRVRVPIMPPSAVRRFSGIPATSQRVPLPGDARHGRYRAGSRRMPWPAPNRGDRHHSPARSV